MISVILLFLLLVASSLSLDLLLALGVHSPLEHVLLRLQEAHKLVLLPVAVQAVQSVYNDLQQLGQLCLDCLPQCLPNGCGLGLQEVEYLVLEVEVPDLVVVDELETHLAGHLLAVSQLVQREVEDLVELVDHALRPKCHAVPEELLQLQVVLVLLRLLQGSLVVVVVGLQLWLQTPQFVVHAEADGRVELLASGRLVKHAEGVEQDGHVEDVVVDCE